jgi:hypothetical protein
MQGISPAPTVLDLPAAEQAFTQWLATTNKVLKDLPNCPDDDFHPGIDNLSEWLLKLFRPSPPAGLSTYTAQEQRDLVEGHVQVMQRLQHLQALLFNLDKAAAKHGNQLRAATARLEAAATEGTRLKAISDSCTADARSRAGQLLQAAAELKVSRGGKQALGARGHRRVFIRQCGFWGAGWRVWALCAYVTCAWVGPGL